MIVSLLACGLNMNSGFQIYNAINNQDIKHTEPFMKLQFFAYKFLLLQRTKGMVFSLHSSTIDPDMTTEDLTHQISLDGKTKTRAVKDVYAYGK